MKHKKLIIATIAGLVAAACVILAGVAFGWWTANASTPGNSVSTADAGLVTSGLPITVSGLVPMVDPAPADPGTTVPDSSYPSVSYFYVHNTGSTPLMFYGWLSGGNDTKAIAPYVHMRIWLLGATSAPSAWSGLPSGWADTFQAQGPWLAYDGTLAGLWTGASAGLNYLSSRGWTGTSWVDTPILPGQYGVYRVATWLGDNAPDSTQNATVSFTINFTGLEPQEWAAHDYDGTPKS
jgi:hypothetical protein